jgi:trans-2,3-dihydro-3-hydroxyanthranilate isomerase
MRYRFVTADVFTDTMFGGNQLAVIPDARGLSDARMQQIAREFNYSESTFILPPQSPDHTRRVRIFTPAKELPFAGHPTVGSAHVLAAIGEVPLTGDATRIVLEEGVGPVPVTVRAEHGKPVFAQFTVAKLPEVGPPPPTRAAIADLLGLDINDLQSGAMTPQAVSCGLPFLIVPLRNRKAVAKARIRLDKWEMLLSQYWAADVLIIAQDPERPGSDIRARMFGPGAGVMEDPATGSAAAALGGYLAMRDGKPGGDGTLRWVIEQGFELGRPSILHVEADRANGAVTAVRVGGASVIVSEGTIDVPEPNA